MDQSAQDFYRTATPFRAPSPDRLASWHDDPFETILFALFLTGLAWAPFWLGGNRPFAWGINGILFPTLALGYEISILVRGRKHPFALKRIAVSAGLYALVVAWICVQISTPLLPGLAHPIWSMASDALGHRLSGAISVNPQQSALALMRLLTNACVFWLALQLGRAARRAYLLVVSLVAIVAVYSAYGLSLSIFGRNGIPFFDAPDTGSFVRSTFVNHNNFATYAGMGLVGAITLILRHYRHEVPRIEGAGVFRVAKLIEATAARGWQLLGAGIIILVALLGTVSRGGIFAAALGVFTVLVLSFARSERSGARRIEIVVFVAAAMLAAVLFFGDGIVERISESGITDASRLAVYAIVCRSLLDSPFLGFGYGTFADVFPMYRDRSISLDGVWDAAHNSYLEVLQGLGVVFGAALFVSIGLLVWKTFRGAMVRRQNASAPIIAASAALLVGMHSMVDFSLGIEAVALTFAALLGAGVAQSESSRLVLSD